MFAGGFAFGAVATAFLTKMGEAIWSGVATNAAKWSRRLQRAVSDRLDARRQSRAASADLAAAKRRFLGRRFKRTTRDLTVSGVVAAITPRESDSAFTVILTYDEPVPDQIKEDPYWGIHFSGMIFPDEGKTVREYPENKWDWGPEPEASSSGAAGRLRR